MDNQQQAGKARLISMDALYILQQVVEGIIRYHCTEDPELKDDIYWQRANKFLDLEELLDIAKEDNDIDALRRISLIRKVSQDIINEFLVSRN